MQSGQLREGKIFCPKLCVLLLVTIVGTIMFSAAFMNRANALPETKTNNINAQEVSSFNATAYWNAEKLRVLGTALNITVSNRSTIEYNGIIYNKTELSYEIPNWVGANPLTLTINATMFTPTNASGHLGLMPGVAVFHGYGGRRQVMYNYSLSIAALNCTVIVPDLPGDGDNANEGPFPLPQYMLYQGDFNKTSHEYLAFCDGIQAIRVLESLNTTTVDSSRIAISGASYGGWISLCVGAILRDKIDLVLPLCFTGDFNSIESTSLWYYITNSTVDESRAWLAAKGATIDPVNYICIPDYPDVCWHVGTTDEFSNYQSINVTYNTVLASGNKWLYIEPNGHHTMNSIEPNDHYTMYSDYTPQFMIRYKFFGGPAPPVITGLPGQRFIDGAWDGVHVKVNIASTASVEEVDVCYKYKELIGDPWHVDAMSETAPGSGTWEGKIDAPWSGASVDYYIIVKVANPDGETWFSSQIFTAGYLNNYLAFLPIGGIVAGIVLLAIAMLRYRYNHEVRVVEPARRKQAKLHFIVENSLLGVTEIMIFSSLVMPWVNISRTLSWSQIYMMNSYFTYTGLLGDLAYSITFLLFLYFTVCALSSLFNPLLSGLLNIVWPVFFLLLLQILKTILSKLSLIPTSNNSVQAFFNSNMSGTGIFVFMFSGIGQVGIWIWKQVYQKRLGVPRRNLIILLKKLRHKNGKFHSLQSWTEKNV